MIMMMKLEQSLKSQITEYNEQILVLRTKNKLIESNEESDDDFN